MNASGRLPVLENPDGETSRRARVRLSVMMRMEAGAMELARGALDGLLRDFARQPPVRSSGGAVTFRWTAPGEPHVPKPLQLRRASDYSHLHVPERRSPSRHL